jgi:hypothetical protein
VSVVANPDLRLLTMSNLTDAELLVLAWLQGDVPERETAAREILAYFLRTDSINPALRFRLAALIAPQSVDKETDSFRYCQSEGLELKLRRRRKGRRYEWRKHSEIGQAIWDKKGELGGVTEAIESLAGSAVVHGLEREALFDIWSRYRSLLEISNQTVRPEA